MLRRIFVVIVILLLAFPGWSQKMSLFDKLLHVSNGDTLPYRLLKPVSPESRDKFPLVIFLHGAGERGSDNEMQLQHISGLFLDERNRGKYPCYLLAPQCPKGVMWSSVGRNKLSEKPAHTLQQVVDLIDQVIAEFPIDETRIYITGLSMGGYATWELIARHPEKFAAAVPVCGGGDPATASIVKSVPIWAFHGALDRTVSPQRSREMVRAIQEKGGSPGYTEYPDVEHNSWVHAYKEPHLIHWLFRQKLDTPRATK